MAYIPCQTNLNQAFKDLHVAMSLSWPSLGPHGVSGVQRVSTHRNLVCMKRYDIGFEESFLYCQWYYT